MRMTKKLAAKVLEIVDAGLVEGVGNQVPGEMCVEAAVCYAMGLPHGDDPGCVSPALRDLKIALNDSPWSSNEARAKGLRRLAVAQLGSNNALDDIEFVSRVAIYSVQHLADTLENIAVLIPFRADDLRRQAIVCRAAKDLTAAESAARSAARSAAESAARSVESASRNAAASALWSAESAAYSTASIRGATRNAAMNAAWSARFAAKSIRDATESARTAAIARSTRNAAASALFDKSLAEYCEGIVQILIAMNAPGCKYLSLTE